jgi:hypothetical protein
MLSAIFTTWLLLQLPVALALARFIACSQKWAVQGSAAHRPIAPHARAA